MTKALLAAVLLVPVVLFGPDGAEAVHGTGQFELEGNAVNDAGIDGDDWDNVCAERNDDGVISDADLAALCGTSEHTGTNGTGATAVEWTDDGALNASIFTGGGSKDPEPIEKWAWKDNAGGLPDKDNLLHAFAARYSLPPDSETCPAGSFATCELLYFGSDRFDNSGDAQQGFWFLQGDVALGTNKIGGGTGFTGSHLTGDILIISEFSNGGSTSTIHVLEWNPAACPSASDTCEAPNLKKLGEAAVAKCTAALDPADPFCGIVNESDSLTTAPWAFLDKSGNTDYAQGEFFEAGLNLSALNLGDRCFSTVVSETRAATSATATLKDFVLGTFGQCGSTLTTTPSDSGGTAVPAGGISITTAGAVAVKDAADLEVTGVQTWSGTLQFFLCGPIASGTCETGGVSAGEAQAVSQSTTQPILSPAVTVTSAGRYCWRGFFDSATVGLDDATDASAGECFQVNPVTPTLSTQAVDGSGANITQVPLGTTLYDNATLSGTAKQPGTNGGNATYPSINANDGANAGGTINFKLYGPGLVNCNNLAAGFPVAGITVNVNGDGTYGGPPTVGFAPTAPGDYFWKAVYSGNAPNTNGTSHNGDCT
ncbi:MAG: hypothetical protein ACRD0N_05930, partial [Acidimicrobiales bacterium]